MAEIHPFRGIRFNTDKVDLEKTVCPPYDVISPEERQELLAQDPHNTVRLILGDGENWHPQAAEIFRQWQSEGILFREDREAMYVYRHRFDLAGQQKTRLGLLCLLCLADPSKQDVLPHEHTFEGPKADRLKLMKACEANMSPIFLLANDPDGKLQEVLRSATANLENEVTDDKNVQHGFAPIFDEDAIRTAAEVLNGQKIFIADGHHRYATSQNYQAWRKSLAPDDPPDAPYNFLMIYICPVEDPGLHILPTNRIVGGLAQEKISTLDERLREHFEVEAAACSSPSEFTAELRRKGESRQVLGVYRKPGVYHFLYPRQESIDKYVGDETRSDTWKSLDVSVLHELILHKILDIGRDRLLDYVKYVREAEKGVELVDQGEKQLAFLLNGTRVKQVGQICLEGEHMPQKSTDFYPKLLTGLVFYGMGE